MRKSIYDHTMQTAVLFSHNAQTKTETFQCFYYHCIVHLRCIQYYRWESQIELKQGTFSACQPNRNGLNLCKAWFEDTHAARTPFGNFLSS